MTTGWPRARAGPRFPYLTLVAAIATLVGGCGLGLHRYTATIPPDVKPFAPTVVGVIERSDSATASQPITYTLTDGTRIERTPETRVVFSTGDSPGGLMAAGRDEAGPWVAFATHVAGSAPDCFEARGIVFDAGDDVFFEGYMFQKAPGFTTSFPSTKPGERYPVGNPCFDAQFQVVHVGVY